MSIEIVKINSFAELVEHAKQVTRAARPAPEAKPIVRRPELTELEELFIGMFADLGPKAALGAPNVKLALLTLVEETEHKKGVAKQMFDELKRLADEEADAKASLKARPLDVPPFTVIKAKATCGMVDKNDLIIIRSVSRGDTGVLFTHSGDRQTVMAYSHNPRLIWDYASDEDLDQLMPMFEAIKTTTPGVEQKILDALS